MIYLGADVDMHMLRQMRRAETRAVFIDALADSPSTAQVDSYERKHRHDPRSSYRSTSGPLRPWRNTTEQQARLGALIVGRLQDTGFVGVRTRGGGVFEFVNPADGVRRELRYVVGRSREHATRCGALFAAHCGTLGTLSTLGAGLSVLDAFLWLDAYRPACQSTVRVIDKVGSWAVGAWADGAAGAPPQSTRSPVALRPRPVWVQDSAALPSYPVRDTLAGAGSRVHALSVDVSELSDELLRRWTRASLTLPGAAERNAIEVATAAADGRGSESQGGAALGGFGSAVATAEPSASAAGSSAAEPPAARPVATAEPGANGPLPRARRRPRHRRRPSSQPRVEKVEPLGRDGVPYGGDSSLAARAGTEHGHAVLRRASPAGTAERVVPDHHDHPPETPSRPWDVGRRGYGQPTMVVAATLRATPIDIATTPASALLGLVVVALLVAVVKRSAARRRGGQRSQRTH